MMHTLNLIGQIDVNGHLRLNVPTHLPPGEVELVLVIAPTSPTSATPQKYDFSDLAGKLHWQGDAIALQRKLRSGKRYLLDTNGSIPLFYQAF